MKHYLDTLLNTFNLSKRFTAVEERTVDYRPSSKAERFFIEQKKALVVLSWNVNKNNQSEAWAREFAGIYTRHQPDIICLQEVCLSAVPNCNSAALVWSKPLQNRSDITPLAQMPWCFTPNFEDAVACTYSGVLTLASASSTRSRGLLTAQTEPVTQTPKASLLTEYALRKRSLLVINTHLINFVSPLIFQAQLDQIAAAIGDYEGAVILAGDFNTWHQDRLHRLQKTAAQLGLSPAAFAPQHARNIKRFLMSPPLDHIFCRGFQQNVLSASVVSPVISSDHRPLVIELSC